MNYMQNNEHAGVPYNDINWYDVDGQPFGTASYFNAMILGDANNIVDTKGAMAVGGNFTSQRGLSLAYGDDNNLRGTGYNPYDVRFLVGRGVAMQGPLVVVGHVVAGGNFRAARGSTYMIGKDGSADQTSQLASLYQAEGGSRYWGVSDRGNHYAVSSYDVPRYIPAGRVNADVVKFFSDAENSLTRYQDCITNLQPNGTVTEHYHEWILRGNDPVQNVFLIDVRPNGILDKEIRFEIPQGSIAIVKIRSGNTAHLRYGLWGVENLANQTLYVFEDARQISMEVPAAIWGSIFAPRAMFRAHPTGGTVSGNAVLASLEVNPGSGFEFHLYPFTGGVICQNTPQMSEPMPEPMAEPMPEPAPETMPMPEPMVEPMPEIMPMPAPVPCPVCPPQQPCPVAPPCPPQQLCPAPPPCPPQQPCPVPPPCPMPPPCSVCPPPPPCPVQIQPIPIPIPIPCPEQEECEECLIEPGLIFGCVWGCECGRSHEWEVRLYRNCGDKKLLYCIKICNCGCFEFRVCYDDYYILMVRPVRSHRGCCKCKSSCRPCVSLKNVGVINLLIK
jgi:choice-of-anchor A domain-containing protein